MHYNIASPLMVLGKIMASPTSPSKLPWFPRKTGDRQTDRHVYAHTDLLYTVTLTAHDCRRWLLISLILYHYGRLFLMNFQGSCTKSTEVQTLGERIYACAQQIDGCWATQSLALERSRFKRIA